MATKNYASKAVDGLKAPLTMVVVMTAFASINIMYKLACLDGMNLPILVAYVFIFALAFTVLLAFFLERKSRAKLTWMTLAQTFFCGLFGGSLAQNLYLEGLIRTSATFAAAIANLVPAMTFILAVSFRLEKLSVGKMSGRLKVVGTFLGISGAMLFTFYKGYTIKLWPSNKVPLIHNHGFVHKQGDRVVGAMMCIGCSVSYASWLIIQAQLSKNYPSHYSSTALISLMGAIQSTIYALIADHNWEDWKLGWNIRLLTVAFSGVVGSGLMVAFQAWCVQLKGPLYVLVFTPLKMILVALAGSVMLDEKLHMGSILGAVLIVAGLYLVLWGKASEDEKQIKDEELN